MSNPPLPLPLLATTFSYRIISFLNFVSFPYERRCESLSLSFSPSFSLFFVRSLSTLLYDYSRYTRLTQLYFGPYDVSLTLPTPWRDAALPLRAVTVEATDFEIEKYIIYITFSLAEMER